ncbi:vacuolar sorting protein 18-like [Panicum virgatum]|uniref:vacuolar sorting protein 18-like n=1 Tax=Panicum virgatum TaxID=38727 RepID=UPI0019D4FDE7|nr:vacuolar sorting protein 18-like [Panicum virgatum]
MGAALGSSTDLDQGRTPARGTLRVPPPSSRRPRPSSRPLIRAAAPRLTPHAAEPHRPPPPPRFAASLLPAAAPRPSSAAHKASSHHRPRCVLSSPADLDLGSGRSGDHSVHRVFLDPGGKHCVVTVVHPGGAETYYHHARWPRPKPLPCLRSLLVNAVAWNRQSITEASTKELILGTESGQIIEMAVDEADKREKYVKPLFELTEREGIKALQMETAVVGNSTRFYVMAVTRTRLYSFTGIGSIEIY